MAPPRKKPLTVTERLETKYIENTFAEFKDRFVRLEERIEELEKICSELESNTVRKPKSIQKVEAFYNEEAPVKQETSMKMNSEDKLNSIRNALRILPSNLRVNGRQEKGNVTAICGFLVTDEMLEEVYQDFVHEEY